MMDYNWVAGKNPNRQEQARGVFPKRRARASAVAPSAATAAGQALWGVERKRVVVADNDPLTFRQVRAALAGLFELASVLCAGEMFKVIANARPDLIVLNHRLPPASGYRALRRLKACPALSDIPVILVTPNQDADIRALRKLISARDTIPEPLCVETLRKLVCKRLDVQSEPPTGATAGPLSENVVPLPVFPPAVAQAAGAPPASSAWSILDWLPKRAGVGAAAEQRIS